MTFYQSLLYCSLTTIDLSVITTSILCVAAYLKFSKNGHRIMQLASKVIETVSLVISIGKAYFGFRSPHDFTQLLIMMAERYGNGGRVWVGFKTLAVIFDANDAGILLNSRKCLEKDSLYFGAKENFGNGLFTAPASMWKANRKHIAPSFNQRILEGFVKIFDEKSSTLITKLKDVCDSGEIDIFSKLANCTLEIVCESTLGWKGDFQNDGAIHADNMTVIMDTSWVRIFYLQYHFDLTFQFTEQYKKFSRARQFFHTLAEKIIKEKIETHEEHKRNRVYDTQATEHQDTYSKLYLDSLIENTSVWDKPTFDYLRDEVVTTIIAGADTTGVAGSFILLALALYQDVQDKVYDEVVNVIGMDREVRASDLPNLMYLEMVIKETLRLFPLACVIGRAVGGDIKLTSCTLPAGSTAVIAIYKTHRDPQHWPDPDRFNPDRFLPDEVAKRNPFAYMPFSAGPRNCIGFKFAIMSLKTIVANIIRKYRIYTTYKSIEEVKLVAQFVVKPADGFKISMQSR